jgi:type II secretory pathway pseudopilin PulG
MGTADEIQKLVELREQGTLTDEEFETQKRAVLARSEQAAMHQQQGTVPPPKTSGLAVASLILSFFCIIGPILGIVALIRMGRQPHLRGKGLAIASIPVGFLFGLGISSAIAIPAFIQYIRKSKTVEATEALQRIAAGARAAAAQDGTVPAAKTDWVPATSCCMDMTTAPKCSPTPQAWSAAPWSALRFSMTDPHYFQYRYAGGGKRFIAEARADLDCDGIFSSYKIDGEVTPDGQVQIRGPIIQNEIE